jgi:hypothetical protein
MDTGPLDDAVYLALTLGLAAAVTVTLWLRGPRGAATGGPREEAHGHPPHPRPGPGTGPGRA